MGYRWDVDDISMGYRWVIDGISMGYRWDIDGLSMGYRWVIEAYFYKKFEAYNILYLTLQKSKSLEYIALLENQKNGNYFIKQRLIYQQYNWCKNRKTKTQLQSNTWQYSKCKRD